MIGFYINYTEEQYCNILIVILSAKTRYIHGRYFRLNMLPKGEVGLKAKLVKGDRRACSKFELAEDRRRLVVHQVRGPECRGVYSVLTVSGERLPLLFHMLS